MKGSSKQNINTDKFNKYSACQLTHRVIVTESIFDRPADPFMYDSENTCRISNMEIKNLSLHNISFLANKHSIGPMEDIIEHLHVTRQGL
jgi:hypothetical protein